MIKIRFGLPYKGSKNAIAEWIVEQLPEGDVLVDLFCGGGAYDTEDGLWKPDKNGLGMAHVFDELNKLYGKDFIMYK